MSRIAAATLAPSVFLAAALALVPEAQASGPAKVVQDWASAHSEGYGARATVLYTPDARVWSVAAPREWVGHDDISHYLTVFALGAAKPAFHIASYSLQSLGEGVVVANGQCAVEREHWDGSRGREDCRFSLTLVQDNTGAWRIAGQHSSALPR